MLVLLVQWSRCFRVGINIYPAKKMNTKGLILRGGKRLINSNWSHLYQQPKTLGFRFVLQAINYYEAALKSGQQNFLRFVSAMFNEIQFSYLWSTPIDRLT